MLSIAKYTGLQFTQWHDDLRKRYLLSGLEIHRPPRPQDFFPDIPQSHLLPPFPRWADPLESDLIQAQTQYQHLVTATVSGCGVDSLCPLGPALQA